MQIKVGDLIVENQRGEPKRVSLDQLAKSKPKQRTFYRCVGHVGRDRKAVLIQYKFIRFDNANQDQRQPDPSGDTGD